MPEQAHLLTNPAFNPKNEEVLSRSRMQLGILLAHDCEIDDDLNFVKEGAKSNSKLWHAAPIFNLSDIAPDIRVLDSRTNKERALRDMIRSNETNRHFYLDPIPDGKGGVLDSEGHYIDFRRLCPVPMDYFLERIDERLATLQTEQRDRMMAHLFWFFTQAEYLYHPVPCPNCGKEMKLNNPLRGSVVDIDHLLD